MISLDKLKIDCHREQGVHQNHGLDFSFGQQILALNHQCIIQEDIQWSILFNRLLRKKHMDSKYCAKILQYMKEMACKFSSKTLMVSLDDKCCVPIGEPDLPQSTGVRQHNRSLGLLGVPKVALDHDFHTAGAVPSVCFLIDILKIAKIHFMMVHYMLQWRTRYFKLQVHWDIQWRQWRLSDRTDQMMMLTVHILSCWSILMVVLITIPHSGQWRLHTLWSSSCWDWICW